MSNFAKELRNLVLQFQHKKYNNITHYIKDKCRQSAQRGQQILCIPIDFIESQYDYFSVPVLTTYLESIGLTIKIRENNIIISW